MLCFFFSFLFRVLFLPLHLLLLYRKHGGRVISAEISSGPMLQVRGVHSVRPVHLFYCYPSLLSSLTHSLSLKKNCIPIILTAPFFFYIEMSSLDWALVFFSLLAVL